MSTTERRPTRPTVRRAPRGSRVVVSRVVHGVMQDGVEVKVSSGDGFGSTLPRSFHYLVITWLLRPAVLRRMN